MPESTYMHEDWTGEVRVYDPRQTKVPMRQPS